MSADTRSAANLLDELRFNGRAHFTLPFRHALADRLQEAIAADFERLRAIDAAEIGRLRGEVGKLQILLDGLALSASIAPAEAKGDALAVARVQRGPAPHDPMYAMLLPEGPLTPKVKEGDPLYLRTPQPADGGAVVEPMTGDLLPCPFCGKSNQDRWPCEWLDGSGANVIRCAWCHGAAPLSAWNRRAAHPAGDALGAARELAGTWERIGPVGYIDYRSAARQLTAALQHRGDSRGGEGS